MHVLLITHDDRTSEEFRPAARKYSLIPHWASNRDSAEEIMAGSEFGAVVLDSELEGASTLIPRIMALRNTAFVVLTDDGVEDRIRWIDLGAEDVLSSPVNMLELAARVKGATRRFGEKVTGDFVYGHLRISFSQRRLFVDGTHTPLVRPQWSILETLARSPEEPVLWDDLQKCIATKNKLPDHLITLQKRTEMWGFPRLIHYKPRDHAVLADRGELPAPRPTPAALSHYILNHRNNVCPRDYEMLSALYAEYRAMPGVKKKDLALP